MALALGTIFSRNHWKWNMTILETRLVFQGPVFHYRNHDSGSGKLPFKYVVTRKSLWNKQSSVSGFWKDRFVLAEGWATGLLFGCDFGWFVKFETGKKPFIQSKNVRAPLTKKRVPLQPFWVFPDVSWSKQIRRITKWNKFKPGYFVHIGRCEVQLHLLVHGYKHAMNDPQRVGLPQRWTCGCWRGCYDFDRWNLAPDVSHFCVMKPEKWGTLESYPREIINLKMPCSQFELRAWTFQSKKGWKQWWKEMEVIQLTFEVCFNMLGRWDCHLANASWTI